MKKTKTQNQTKNDPPASVTEDQTKNVAASSNTGNQPKKKNGCLVGAIIAIAFFILIGVVLLIWMWPFIFTFLLDLKNGDLSLPKTTQTQNSKGTLKGKDLSSLIDPSKTITKRITAKNGGRVTAQTANGLYFTLNIGPGSLKKDTDISITPINESPIENYPNPDDPGVVIGPPNTNLGDDSTVTVSEDPPATEPDGSGDPGAPPGTPPDVPPTAPPETPPDTPPTDPSDTPPGTTGDIPDLAGLLALLGKNTMTTTPSENPSGQGSGTTGNTGANRDDRNAGSSSSSGSGAGSSRFSDKTVLIFVGYGGGVNPVPTEHSDDDDSITGPIDETGGTTEDDPDEDESEDLADNAAAVSGGTCSPEFLQVMANAAQAGGAGSSAAQAALRDCFNVEWLNNLCVNDPVKLRRTYFEQRLILARRYDAQAASEIESLMNQCQAEYRFQGEGVAPESMGSGVTIFSSLDANVCGYVDDEWMGTQVYQLSIEGGGHYFGGTTNFHLPSGGGEFSGTSHGSNSLVVAGRSVEIPNFAFGFTGHFDGYKTILDMNLYPATIVSGRPIELQEKSCIPLAPLSR